MTESEKITTRTLDDLAELTGGKVQGDPGTTIIGACSLDNPKAGISPWLSIFPGFRGANGTKLPPL